MLLHVSIAITFFSILSLITITTSTSTSNLRRHRNVPLISQPDEACPSGYARQDSFDPVRNGPICLTDHEVQQTTPGGNPGQTVPISTTDCPSGFAHASSTRGAYDSVPVCLTIEEASDFRRRTALTPHVVPKSTRLSGRIDVKIHEFDSEGGEHVRTVGVPLDESIAGTMDYDRKHLVRLKLKSLLQARNVVREQFGVKKSDQEIFHGIHHDPARIPEEEGDYEQTLSRSKK
jgi:hypothetical protein